MTLSKALVKTPAVVCVFVVLANLQLLVLMITCVPTKFKPSAVTPSLLLLPLSVLPQTNVLLCLVTHVVKLEELVFPNLLIAVDLLDLITVPHSPVTWELVCVLFQTLMLVLHVIVLGDHGLNGPPVPFPVELDLKPDLDHQTQPPSMVVNLVLAHPLIPEPVIKDVVQPTAFKLPGLPGDLLVVPVELEPKLDPVLPPL